MFGLPDIFHSAMCTEYRLKTIKDLTPEELAARERHPEIWWSRMKHFTYCNRCGNPYQEPSPKCPNAKTHDL